MRQFYPNVAYFITIPTINHQPFFDTDVKKDILLESILIAKEKFNIKELDFCLLKNHHHSLCYFEDSKIIPQFVKQISGRSGKLLNKYEHVKNRKIWDDYYIYFVNNDDAYYRIKGYVIGNAYKHGAVHSLDDLGFYKYSTFSRTAKEIGQRETGNMVLSSISMSDSDWAKELKLIKGSQTP